MSGSNPVLRLLALKGEAGGLEVGGGAASRVTTPDRGTTGQVGAKGAGEAQLTLCDRSG